MNELRRSNKMAWESVDQNTKFRQELYKLLLTEEDLIVEHPRFGRMYMAEAHPNLMPLLIERIKKLLGEK